jgi:hypothetical protein
MPLAKLATGGFKVAAAGPVLISGWVSRLLPEQTHTREGNLRSHDFVLSLSGSP